MTFHRVSHFVQSIFCVLAEYGLAGLKADFCLVRSLVLVDVSNNRFHGLDASGSHLCALLRCGGFVASVDGVLIGFISFVGGQLDAGLGALIGVFDRLAVSRGQIVQFVNAITDGLGLALNVFLAGERIHSAPETFAGRRLKGLLAGGRCQSTGSTMTRAGWTDPETG